MDAVNLIGGIIIGMLIMILFGVFQSAWILRQTKHGGFHAGTRTN